MSDEPSHVTTAPLAPMTSPSWSNNCMLCTKTKTADEARSPICDACGDALYETASSFPQLGTPKVIEDIRTALARVVDRLQRWAHNVEGPNGSFERNEVGASRPPDLRSLVEEVELDRADVMLHIALGRTPIQKDVRDYTKLSDKDLLDALWIAAHGLDLRRGFPAEHVIVKDLRGRLRAIGEEIDRRRAHDKATCPHKNVIAFGFERSKCRDCGHVFDSANEQGPMANRFPAGSDAARKERKK